MAKKSYFTFVGKIRPLKENGLIEKSDEAWKLKQLNFQAICGDNVQYLRIKSFVWTDIAKNVIKTKEAVKNGEDKDLLVNWNDRLDPIIVSKVSGLKSFVIDTDTYAHRKELKDAENTTELEESNKKYHKFLHASDFLDCVDAILHDEETKNMVFKITGSVNFSYSAEHNQYYREFIPTKITRVPDDTEKMCQARVPFLFSKDSIDKSFVEETGDVLFNVYGQYYDSQVKNEAFVPMQLRVSADDMIGKMIINKMESSWNDGIEVRECGVVIDCINGAKQVEITMDMLNEDQKALIAMGKRTLEHYQKTLGTVQGDKITENRIVDIIDTYADNGLVDTGYTPADLEMPPQPSEENKAKASAQSSTVTKKTESKTKTSTAKAAAIFDEDEESDDI